MSHAELPSPLSAPLPAFRRHCLTALAAITAVIAAPVLAAPGKAGTAAGAADLQWIGSWGAAPSNEIAGAATTAPPPFANHTVRMVITLSAGGDAIRLRLSNELGAAPVRIDAVTIARWKAGAVVPGTMQTVRFAAHDTVLIPSGAATDSDPLPLVTANGEQLAISLHVPGPAQRLTGHVVGLDPSWTVESKATAAEALPAALPGFSRLVLSRVDVGLAKGRGAAIVALGDSITDGYQSSFAQERRWPDVLARLLAANPRCTVGVVNQGISGNRVLADGEGLSAAGRLQRDVFSVPGARTLILLEGVNDLGYPLLTGEAPPTAADLEGGLRHIADEAHARGMRVIAGAIMPFKHVAPPYFTPEGERVRREVNEWMRTSGVFDAFVDLDSLLADPADREALAPPFDSGDGIHPSDKGYEAIGNAFFKVLGQGGQAGCAG